MISTVIPVFNESESLAELHRQLSEVAAEHAYTLDVVFVDDGSTDASWQEISKLSEADDRVQGIRFRRNFGKAAALAAGFKAARGDLVMTLDADLQDDPHEIPRFIEKMDDGFDVISGWKKVRHDPWHKVGPSRVFNWMVSTMTGVHLHDHNCGMKLYRREIFDEVRLYGELHRFVPVLAAARGWKAGEIPIQHRPRKFGRSKYGIFRILKGFLDLLTVRFITGYGHRPQHVLGTLGLLGFGLGFGGLLILTALWIVTRFSPLAYWFDPVNLHERAIFFYCICAVILGAQFFSVGFLAEMMAAHNTQGLPPYSIAERTGAPEHGGECDLSEKPETEAKRAETALR